MSAGQRDQSDERAQLVHDTLSICFARASLHWLHAEAFVEGEHLGATGCCDAADPATKFDNVTLATVDLGYRRLIEGSVVANRNIVAAARRAFRDPLDGNIDDEAADVILQAGLLGRVVYKRRRPTARALARVET